MNHSHCSESINGKVLVKYSLGFSSSEGSGRGQFRFAETRMNPIFQERENCITKARGELCSVYTNHVVLLHDFCMTFT